MPEYPKQYDIDDGEFGDDYAAEIEIIEHAESSGWRKQLTQMMNSEQ